MVGGGTGSASVGGGAVGIVVGGPVEIVVTGGPVVGVGLAVAGPGTVVGVPGPTVVGTAMPAAEPVSDVIPAGLEGVPPVPLPLVVGAPAVVDGAKGSDPPRGRCGPSRLGGQDVGVRRDRARSSGPHCAVPIRATTGRGQPRKADSYGESTETHGNP